MNSEQIKFPIRKFAANKKISFYSNGRSSHYDSTVGRWTTKDPIGFAGGDTNLYAYVGGNPMSYVDPKGNRLPVAAHIFSKKDTALLQLDLSYARLIHFCAAL